MKQTNPQVEQMTSFIVMDVLERANELQKQGIDIIHLEVGEPDFDVPVCVAEAAKKAYDSHLTHYTHSLGDPELRKEIAAFHQQEYGVTVDPDCIVVTSGSSPAIPSPRRTKFPSILPAACRKLAVTLSRVSPRSLLSIWFTVPLPLVPAP